MFRTILHQCGCLAVTEFNFWDLWAAFLPFLWIYWGGFFQERVLSTTSSPPAWKIKIMQMIQWRRQGRRRPTSQSRNLGESHIPRSDSSAEDEEGTILEEEPTPVDPQIPPPRDKRHRSAPLIRLAHCHVDTWEITAVAVWSWWKGTWSFRFSTQEEEAAAEAATAATAAAEAAAPYICPPRAWGRIISSWRRRRDRCGVNWQLLHHWVSGKSFFFFFFPFPFHSNEPKGGEIGNGNVEGVSGRARSTLPPEFAALIFWHFRIFLSTESWSDCIPLHSFLSFWHMSEINCSFLWIRGKANSREIKQGA